LGAIRCYKSAMALHLKPRLLAIALAIALAPAPCFAWGVEGHHIVAEIAARELMPAARSQVAELLGGDAEQSMIEVSTWADEIRRGRPNTAPWHFVDIPIGSAGYDPGRDCRRNNCVVAQIEREKTIVADRSLTPAVRAEALRFLIHFVGDIHQPMHAADNGDRGGNQVRVVLAGKRSELHAVWDTAVVQSLGTDAGALANDLRARVTAADRKKWQAGDAQDWANESFQVASAEIYAKVSGAGGTQAPIILPASYAASERGVAAAQLEKAGIRLAWLLNAAFR